MANPTDTTLKEQAILNRVFDDVNDALNVNATVSVDTTGLATDTNQTNGSQKTQIVDAGGEAVTVTGGKLDVNATASLAGESLPVSGATSGVAVAIVDGSGNQITSFGGGTQYTEGDTDASITGTALMVEDGSNTLRAVTGNVANGLDVDVTRVSGTVTVDGSGVTQPISAASLPLPSGAATSAKQDSLLTELQLKADLTETQPVSLASVPSHAVTNAGTFAVQVDGAALTSLQLIDDTVFVDDTATHSTGSTKGIGIMAVATPTDTSVNANDIGMPAMSTDRHFLTDANILQGDSDVGSGNPLQVTLANTGANATAVKVNVASGGIASGAVASGAIASGAFASGAVGSGAIASGAVASGAFASGALASGSIAAGAIAVGATSIAENEDVASAGADTMVKVGQIRQDTPIANASVSNDGDYLNFRADNFGKTWVTGTVPEDTAHVAGEGITVMGARRIDTIATSAGSSGDWATVNQTAEGALWVTITPSATGGATTMNATSSDGATALTSTAQVIKASAGTLKGYYIYNPNSSAQFVQFYNTAAASVTVGTTNPLFMITIPATSAANLWMTDGVNFSNAGWSWAATSTAGGNGAPSTALDAVAWYI